MKKKLFIAAFAGTILSGCYAHTCPTYAVKPEKEQEIKINSNEDMQQKERKIPS